MLLFDRLSRTLRRVYMGIALGIGISVVYIAFLVSFVSASSTPMVLIPMDVHTPMQGER